ncbi:MAG: HNH endonuclease signature motif containing protein [Syntrophorhabdaceae bacterium]|nr:HNH endonuclease signature motif containing protein [Syntrophorhabdaceae bacterium]
MPTKPKKPCSYPGCPALTDGGRCEQHRRKERERYDAERGNSGERGYDAKWQRVRALKLMLDPLCEQHVKKGQDVAAVLVHHIEPIEKQPELRLVMSNLMSLCQPCHEEIHGKERWGR